MRAPRSYNKPRSHPGISHFEKGTRTHVFLLLRPSIQAPTRKLSLSQPPAESLVVDLIQPIQYGQGSNTHKYCGVIGIKSKVRDGARGDAYLGQHDSRRQ